MNIVAIIPARGGSKGIPRKNIKIFAGKPLIYYTINSAFKSRFINKVVVSTEDDEIAEISKSFGAEVVKRPEEFATDNAKTAPVVLHAVSELEKNGYFPDIIVLLNPTYPLRDEKLIDSVLEEFLNSDKDSYFTGFRYGISMPLWKHNLDGTYTALYDYHNRPRRQEKEKIERIYSENGALYAVKRDALFETGDFLGNNVGFYDSGYQVDIDTPEEFEKAEQLYLSQKK